MNYLLIYYYYYYYYYSTMASSLFKSRSEYKPTPKFYGYKSISIDEEKKLIERLSKPTISIIQSQLTNLSNHNQIHTLNSIKSKFNIENNNNVSHMLNDSQTLTIPTISSPTLSSTSSSHLIDSKSISDNENVKEPLQKLSEIWHKTEQINPFLPMCACIRGELLLKENNENWLKNTPCGCCYSSRCSSVRNQYKLHEPVEWKKLNKIVRRLHSTNTIGSIARQKENHALLTALSSLKQHSNKSIDYHIKKTNKIQNIFQLELTNNLFNNRGYFKPIEYIHQWEILQQVNHQIDHLSRPTTSSKLKCRGYCPLCNNLISTITPLGIFTNYSLNKNLLKHQTFHLINKKQQNNLIARIIQPTIASQADKCQCHKLYNKHNNTDNNHIQLSGEFIIQRLQQLHKQLPLISGLSKSSNINSIINRLYSSGKCYRSNCLYKSQ
ncbi:hypothetical protein MN116_005394 [Schistosoma mekongi]|uniref:Uncharacterized protein n=1 Tax=Schistosoma mekongi TaxID=38744 RepID=A0AAE1ZEM1_SCHME|nr:hypothetical protein MN116_005394 [Schistosoma mekongi]